MRLKDIGIILTPSFRAMAYLQKLIRNRTYPNFAIIMYGKNKNFLKSISKENKLHYFEKFQDFEVILKKYKVPYKKFYTQDCNDKNIINAIRSRTEKYFIYSGGGILKNEILSLGKKFIHVHPGIVPQYRGSTCIYYSILNEDRCGASAFFMSREIDAGEVIAKRVFKKPKIINIDYEYDSYIRSELLLDIIKIYIKNGKFDSQPQKIKNEETYFIIHPVLKHLAILSCIKNL